MKKQSIICAGWLLLTGLMVLADVNAQAAVTVTFTTTNATPLNPGFAGFNTAILTSSVEYYDTNFQALAATLSPGWLRYPAGTRSSAFAWTNGLTPQSWVNAWSNYPSSQVLMQDTIPFLAGKGGALLTDFAGMAARIGGAKIVVCVNGFTDTPQSAGALAAFTLSNHIPVAAWELCNEPYLYYGAGGFFTNAADYLDQMRRYRDAIKASNSNAAVAIFFSDIGHTDSNWDNGLASYPDRYWDMVTFHHYPGVGTNVTFADLMATDNNVLANQSTHRVLNYLVPKNDSNVTYMITEYNALTGQTGTGPTTDGTLYGGIYAAEYTMRMSTLPQMRFVGSQELQDANGIDVTNNEHAPVIAAYNRGGTTNTAGLPFGFYITAQATCEAVANWALFRSTGVYATTASGGATVRISGGGTIPAVYAQAYQGGNGKRYVLLTNKGPSAHTVQVIQDGVVLTNQFLQTFAAGASPDLVNTNPPPNPVQIQTLTAANPVTIPGYAVVRLEWMVANVPAPKLTTLVSNASQQLRWWGLSNVVYSVQDKTNLLTPWSTLAKVSSAGTNFSFTNANSIAPQFYRLAVP